MGEPLTKAEMQLAWKAARERLNYAGVKLIRAEAIAAELQRKMELSRKQKEEADCLEAARLIAKARADRYSYEFILATVARAHQISVAELKGPRRATHVLNARMHAIHVLITARPDLSLVFIGKAVGGRDHSTVINARKKWPRRALACGRQVAEVERMLTPAEGIGG